MEDEAGVEKNAPPRGQPESRQQTPAHGACGDERVSSSPRRNVEAGVCREGLGRLFGGRADACRRARFPNRLVTDCPQKIDRRSLRPWGPWPLQMGDLQTRVCDLQPPRLNSEIWSRAPCFVGFPVGSVTEVQEEEFFWSDFLGNRGWSRTSILKQQASGVFPSHLLNYAKQLGVTLVWDKDMEMSIARALLCKMTNRVGWSIFQTVAVQCNNVPHNLWDRLLPARCITTDSQSSTTWNLNRLEDLTESLGRLPLAESGYNCKGLSRALRTESETCCRVIATMMPMFEVSATRSNHQVKSFINGQFVLTDHLLCTHWPKDEDRREIIVHPLLRLAMEKKIREDLNSMADEPGVFHLSDHFYMSLDRDKPPPPPSPAPKPSKGISTPKVPKPLKTCLASKMHPLGGYIVREEVTAGRAGKWYLVRWRGYNPLWEPWRIHGEVGSPVETWEPRCNLSRSDELENWECRSEDL